jgi:hypothetical protein
MRLHGVVLNCLSTGTNLRFAFRKYKHFKVAWLPAEEYSCHILIHFLFGSKSIE